MSLHSFNTRRGFSLVELLVSISIMVVITTVVVYNQRDYSNNQSLRNAVSVLSLEIRQAQVYGISVRELTVNGNNFQSDYGITFYQPDLHGYYLFADQGAKNGIWDTGSAEDISTQYFPTGVIFAGLSVIMPDGSEQGGKERIDITFRRPDVNPRISIEGVPLASLPGSPIGARIKLQSVNGLTRSVSVYTTGQISVQ